MTKDHAGVWEGCLHTIKQNVNTQSFKTWFEPIKPVRLTDNSLTIQVPNHFFYEWLEEHYVALLRTTIHEALGNKGRLEYEIVTSNPTAATQPSLPTQGKNGKTGNPEKAQNDLGAPGSMDSENIKNPFVIPGLRRIVVDPQLMPSLTFDNYIQGSCNELARSAGWAVAHKPGGTAFNPLFIYGDVGLGKTHLAQAIGNKIVSQEAFKNKNVLYVSCDKFIEQVVQSIRNNATNDVVNFYQMIDVLIVDDIYKLAGKTKTQEIFFSIFNNLHQSGKQLIFTSDKAPKDMSGIEDRLLSRFKWGLSADLTHPDLETKMAIMECKMKQEGVSVPNDVIEFVCYNVQNNIRELEGVLVGLIANSSLRNRTIDMDLAREVVRRMVQHIRREITVDYIKEVVSKHFSVSMDNLQGKTRKRHIVIARQLSMFLARKFTNSSLKAIGDSFSGRDHSTVLHACQAVQDSLDTNKVFTETVAEVEKMLKMSLNS
jgi:chromosomal replication initiator protein